MSKLLSIIIDVFGKPKHNYHPYLVRLNLNVPVVHVGLIKCLEKPITCIAGIFLILQISINFLLLSFLLPYPLQSWIKWVRALRVQSFEVLNGDGPVALVNILELNLLDGLIFLFLSKLLPYFVEKGHFNKK